MSKILLTGGRGFVGTNVREALAADHTIICPSREELDLLNFDSIWEFMADHSPDIIIHAAGQVGGIQANINNNYSFFYNNLMMGVNLIKAATNTSVGKFLNLGSSCIYPKDLDRCLLEDDILNGRLEPTNEGYALSKISVMKMGEFLHERNLNFHFKTIIPSNLYGPHDKFDSGRSHMIPSVIMKIKDAVENGKEVEIWGNGEARREFLYISDLVDFIGYAVNNMESIPIRINVGLGRDYTIKEYYDAISKVIGYTGCYKYNLDKPVGMKKKLLNIELANSLGWEPKISLIEGIEKTYKYIIGN